MGTTVDRSPVEPGVKKGRKNNLTGIYVGRLNLDHMLKVAKILKVDIDGLDAEQASTTLAGHFRTATEMRAREYAAEIGIENADTLKWVDLSEALEARGAADPEVLKAIREKALELFECDLCDGESPGNVPLEVCPFCADGNEIGSGSDVNKAAKAAKAADAAKQQEATVETTTASSKKKNGAANGSSTALAKASSAAVVVDDTRPASQLVTNKQLDAAVEKVHQLKVIAATGGWKLGNVLAEIFDKDMWKLRLDANGKQRYKNPEAFFLAECEMSPQYCFKLMEVAKKYPEKAIATWGAKKFMLLLQAPEEDRPAIEAKIHKGASAREVEKEVKEASKKLTGTTKKDRLGRTRPAKVAKKRKAPEEKIAIATLLGKHTLPLFKKPANPRKTELKDCAAAKRLADVPWTKFSFENNTVAYFTLGVKATGELTLIMDVKREEEADAAE